jgi:hypothetical protein
MFSLIVDETWGVKADFFAEIFPTDFLCGYQSVIEGFSVSGQ